LGQDGGSEEDYHALKITNTAPTIMPKPTSHFSLQLWAAVRIRVADPVGLHLETVFDEGDAPTGQDGQPQFLRRMANSAISNHSHYFLGGMYFNEFGGWR